MDAKAKVVAWLCQKSRNRWNAEGTARTGEIYVERHVVDTVEARDDYEHCGYTSTPLIPLTDHEAALAELRTSIVDLAFELADQKVAREASDRERTTLRSGLEALAGEWDVEALRLRDADWHTVASAYEKNSYELRTLASSATGEKNTEEEMK